MDTLIQVAAGWILPALFFWFLFSIMAMILIEAYQRYMGTRQKGLEEVIEELLGKIYVTEFFQHALVNPLEGEGDAERKTKRPSYISPTLFAKVIIDWMLKNHEADKVDIETIRENIGEIKDSQLKGVLNAIVTQAFFKKSKDSEPLNVIQNDLEIWFLDAVEKMSSVYASRLQRVTILMSTLVAFAANFDVISITVRLWTTSKQAEIVALYEITKQKILIERTLFETLPVGWHGINIPSTPFEWALKALGICLGAFFIALGSQYVYNLTKKQYKPAK